MVADESDEDLVEARNNANMQPLPLLIIDESEDLNEDMLSAIDSLKSLAKDSSYRQDIDKSIEPNKKEVFEEWCN